MVTLSTWTFTGLLVACALAGYWFGLLHTKQLLKAAAAKQVLDALHAAQISRDN